MVKLEKPKGKERGINFSISNSGAMGNDVLSVCGLSMSYPNRPLFDNISFELKRGERLFIIGANGTGKSTLLKILTGREKQREGIFELGYNQKIGYYDQEQQLLDQNNSVIDEIWSVYSDKTNTEIRSMLARFGFRGEDVFKSISVLSGGERARVSIAKMVACGVSLLILDEPTNHLDIDSREMLETALNDYDGTIIAVSHDRYFIRSLATSILEIDKNGYPDGFSYKNCGYDEFIEKQTAGAGKTSFEEAKQRKNQFRSAKTRYAAAEKEIAKLEEELFEIKSKQNDESILSDYVALNQLYESEKEHENKIDELYSELERLEEIISSYNE